MITKKIIIKFKINDFICCSILEEIMHKLIKNIFKNQLYFFLFISVWLCIDTNFENILSLKNDIEH